MCLSVCIREYTHVWLWEGSLENNPLCPTGHTHLKVPPPPLILAHLSLFGHAGSSAGDWSRTKNSLIETHTHLCRLVHTSTHSQHVLCVHTNTHVYCTQVQTWSRCCLYIMSECSENNAFTLCFKCFLDRGSSWQKDTVHVCICKQMIIFLSCFFLLQVNGDNRWGTEKSTAACQAPLKVTHMQHLEEVAYQLFQEIGQFTTGRHLRLRLSNLTTYLWS